jgi:hypothetical protein
MDDEEDDSSRTESNSAKINESQNMNSAAVKTAANGNLSEDINEDGVSKSSQNSNLPQAKPKDKKTPNKSKTGYMGLRKGFLL